MTSLGRKGPAAVRRFRPAWTRDWRRVGPVAAVVVAVAVLTALLVTAPDRKTDDRTTAAGPRATKRGATEDTDTIPENIIEPPSELEQGPAGAKQAPGGPASGPSGPGGGVAPGAGEGAGTGVGGGGGGATYQGVADKSVKMGFTWQHAQCGNFFGPGVAAAFGVPQPNEEESIKAAIEYFERFPDVAFPSLPAELQAGVSAETGYWGRRVQAVFEDNGGPFCSDKARATAIKLAEQDKALGTVQIPNDGANAFLAPEMAARKLLNFGAPGATRALYGEWEPYVYDITFSGTDVVDAWGSWACRDLVGKQSGATGDPTTSGKRRVLAVVYPDQPIPRTLAGEVEAVLEQCGGSFPVKIAYPTDIDQQAAAASNAIAQFRSRGVTTVYMMTDPLFSATLTSASTGQAFFPEWGVSSIGFNDVAFVVQHFYDERQKPNVLGASHLSSSTAPPWRESTAYKAWKLVRPDREPPGDWNNWYLQILVLYAGMAGAGEELTPQTLAAGLQKVCSPCARFSKKDVMLGFGPGDSTGVDDFTLVKFNPEKENKHDPGDGTGRSSFGDWDFPEGGRRYFRTIARSEE